MTLHLINHYLVQYLTTYTSAHTPNEGEVKKMIANEYHNYDGEAVFRFYKTNNRLPSVEEIYHA